MGYLEWNANGPSRSFAISWLDRSVNPSVANLLNRLSRFDREFGDEFQEMLDADGGALTNDLSTLVTKRHTIAHGESGNLGSRRAVELYLMAKNIADWIVRTFDPRSGRASSFSR